MEINEETKVNNKDRLRKFQIAMDLIFIILLICSLFWVITHWEEVSLLASDPCRLCEEKTGGVCSDRYSSRINLTMPSENYLESNKDTP